MDINETFNQELMRARQQADLIPSHILEWDLRFVGLAKEVSQWSKDPSTKVGAVIVDPRKRLVSLGFNGFARGIGDTPGRLNNREEKYPRVIHAEENAILFAQRPLEGCCIYTYPAPSCHHCTSLIIQTGITRVVAHVGSRDYWSRWGEQVLKARDDCYEAGLIVQWYDFPR